MNTKSMEPFGLALLSYFEGNSNAELTFRRSDGKEETLPVSLFFRELSDFSVIEKTSIELCKGHVLDIGVGAGSQSIVFAS